jgi:hypothetical protein
MRAAPLRQGNSRSLTTLLLRTTGGTLDGLIQSKRFLRRPDASGVAHADPRDSRALSLGVRFALAGVRRCS